MAKKGKVIGKSKYDFVHADKFREILQERQNSNKRFLGFKLKLENVNQLWRWDTLEDISLQ
jgi:hypothetical protein